jgi:uroporphyrinogen-III decarboxylase
MPGMNSRERVNSAMQGERPDRVPVWCLLSLEHIIRFGTRDGAIPGTIEELVEAECRLAKRYRFDGTVIYQPGQRRGTKIDAWIEEALSTVPHGDPSHVFERAHPESWPRPRSQYETDGFYSSHLAREMLGTDHHLGGWVADGFSLALQWFPHLEAALIATVQDPVRFKALVDYFDEYSAAWGAAQVELGGLESIQISSPYAGSSFISPAMYRRFVLPSVGRAAEAIGSAGGFSYLHTCGFISDRLEVFLETGVDGLECMDPPPLGDVTLADAKRRVGSQLFLKGNIDSVNVLLQGDDETVDRTIRATIEAGMPGGGYILSTACSVAPAVPPERVGRLWELVEQEGWY